MGKHSGYKFFGFLILIANDLVDPLLIGWFWNDNNRPFTLSAKHVMSQGSYTCHCLTNSHIQRKDAASHCLHKGNAFPLYVGKLKDTAFKLCRTFKTDRYFMIRYVALPIIQTVPGIVKFFLISRCQDFMQKPGEKPFAFNPGIGFEFGFFFLAHFIIPQRTVCNIVVCNVNSGGLFKVRICIERKEPFDKNLLQRIAALSVKTHVYLFPVFFAFYPAIDLLEFVSFFNIHVFFPNFGNCKDQRITGKVRDSGYDRSFLFVRVSNS